MIRPLGKHILIVPQEEESNVFMPELSKEPALRGTILGIGSKCETEAEVGEVVIFRKYSPEVFELDGKDVYLIEEDDLMAVVQDE